MSTENKELLKFLHGNSELLDTIAVSNATVGTIYVCDDNGAMHIDLLVGDTAKRIAITDPALIARVVTLEASSATYAELLTAIAEHITRSEETLYGKEADGETEAVKGLVERVADLESSTATDGAVKALGNRVTSLENNKVDKAEGKDLIATTDIEKLAAISAEANKVEKSETNGNIKIDGTEVVVYSDGALAQRVADLEANFGDGEGTVEAQIAAAVGALAKTHSDDKTELTNAINAKVASVTAGDNSVTIAGTTTAPTVAAKLSADADNALTLAEDGLKVVIPAAAEYSIVKAADSGDYAAVYNLTKDGTIVGASINIPKDLVVKSGSVVNDEIVLVLNDEAATEIKIPVASLIEYITSGSQTGDMVVITVSDDHKVTAEITDGTITLTKLTTEVQTAIGKAHSHENKDVIDGINADKVAAWDAAEQNAKDYTDTKISEIPSATWESLPDKPFYSELVPGTTLYSSEDAFTGEYNGRYYTEIYRYFTDTSKNYYVTIDGVTTLCTGRYTSGVITPVHNGISGAYELVSPEGIVLVQTQERINTDPNPNNKYYGTVCYSDAPGTYQVEIREQTTAYHCIDDNFISENIARTADIDRLDARIDAIPELTWDNLENKPFTEVIVPSDLYFRVTNVGLDEHGYMYSSGAGTYDNLQNLKKLVPGAQYKVVVDNVEFIATCSMEIGSPFGPTTESSYLSNNAGITISINYYEGDTNFYNFTVRHSGKTYNPGWESPTPIDVIEIYGLASEVITLDDKFLSNTIARITDVEALEATHDKDIEDLKKYHDETLQELEDLKVAQDEVIQANTEAIALLNSDAETVGSVDKKIADAIAPVKATADAAAVKTEVEAALNGKANVADVYTKTETFTKEQVQEEINKALEAALAWGTFPTVPAE